MTRLDRLARLLRPTPRRLRAAGGLAGLVAAALVVTSVPALTNASWTEAEWAHGDGLGTQTCATATNFQTRGAGRFLGANLLGVPIAAIAAVPGVVATKSGSAASVVTPVGVPPVSGAPADANTYANPLNVTLLNGALSASLTNVLELPLSASTPVGAYNQYARAEGSGYSAGASGLVSNSGAIDVTGPVDPANLPTVASFDLHTFTSDILGRAGLTGTDLSNLVAGVANLNLGVGAVASSATLDGCAPAWGGSLASSLARQYLVAGLGLNVGSPLLGDITGSVRTTVTGLQGALNGLTGNASLLSSLQSSVSGLLTGALSALGLGAVNVNVTAAADFSGVTALLGNSYHDANNTVFVNLSTGTVTVDLAKLLGGVNGLNNLAPNTSLLVNAAVVNTLTTALLDALGQFVSAVTAALTTAINAIVINGTVGVTLTALGLNVAQANLTLTNVRLSALTGSGLPAGASITVNALGLVNCTPPISPLDVVSTLVCGLLGTLTTTLTAALPALLGTAIHAVVDPLTTGLATTLHNLAGTVTSPIVRLLANLLNGLLGPGGLASVLVNVQNAPLSGSAPPSDWTGITAGRYDEAALRIGILGLLGAGQDVDVVLARSSVGPNTAIP
jgi:hypothetical protein